MFLFQATFLHAQHDLEYEWISLNACDSFKIGGSVFAVVEHAPVIFAMTPADFKDVVLRAFDACDLEDGEYKLKFLISEKGQFCWSQIGKKGKSISGEQAEVLESSLPGQVICGAGRQRNIEVNCLGVVLLSFDQGTLMGYRTANFSFDRS